MWSLWEEVRVEARVLLFSEVLCWVTCHFHILFMCPVTCLANTIRLLMNRQLATVSGSTTLRHVQIGTLFKPVEEPFYIVMLPFVFSYVDLFWIHELQYFQTIKSFLK